MSWNISSACSMCFCIETKLAGESTSSWSCACNVDIASVPPFWIVPKNQRHVQVTWIGGDMKWQQCHSNLQLCLQASFACRYVLPWSTGCLGIAPAPCTKASLEHAPLHCMLSCNFVGSLGCAVSYHWCLEQTCDKTWLHCPAQPVWVAFWRFLVRTRCLGIS